MGMIDKMQSGVEKMTGDRGLNAAEVTTLQQAYQSMQLGLVKARFYEKAATNDKVKDMQRSLAEDFLEANLERPKKILDRIGAPYLDLDAVNRSRNVNVNTGVLRDEEIVLDTVLAMQATIAGFEAGALGAVRGEVRDFFLEARDAAFDQWRKIGRTAMDVIPRALPPDFPTTQSR